MAGNWDFCLNSIVTENIPPEQGRGMDMNGWVFTAKPTVPYQLGFKITIHGMRWYLQSNGLYDEETDSLRNARRFERFIQAHGTWASFTFPHPHLGSIPCRFRALPMVPKGAPNSAGLIEAFEVELVHHDSAYEAAFADPPVNTSAPVASGIFSVGSFLNVTVGSWTNSPTGYGYQWRRDGNNIPGATSNSYRLQWADVGTVITCLVTAANSTGSAAAVSNSLSLYSSYALALDFKDQDYWDSGVKAASLSAMAGYAYTRSGAKGEINALTGTDRVDDFAASVPGIVPGVGYWSRLPATNLYLRSQEFDNASWGKTTAAVTPNTITAPDGTVSADTVTYSAGAGAINQFPGIAASTGYTMSVFAKAGTLAALDLEYSGFSSSVSFNLATGLVTATNNATGYIEYIGDGWYRCVMIFSNITAGSYLSIRSQAAGTLHLWQAQVVAGVFADGGPIVVTAGATAAVGADVLEVSNAPADTGDQLFWVTTDVKQIVGGNNEYLAAFIDNIDNNYLLLGYQSTMAVAQVMVAGSVVVNQQLSVAGQTGKITLLALRAGGQWRGGMVKNGVLTWFAAAETDGFPANLSKLRIGHSGNLFQPNDPISGIFRKFGTFATDAAVLAAVAETI